jgi:hypothetical protein
LFFKLCQKLPNHLIISFVNKTTIRCYTIGQCHLTFTINDHYDHHIINLKQNNYSSQLYFSLKFKILINHDHYNKQILFSLITKNGTVNTTKLSTKTCYIENELVKRNTRLGRYIIE